MNRRLAIVFLLGIAIFLPRLVGLGSLLSTDEPLWQGRSKLFLKSLATLNFAGTSTSIQPGVTTTWVGGLALPFGELAAAQTGVAVVSGILVSAITYFLVLLWGWRWGMVGGFVLALDPFLIAHSRYIHTDALLALFLLLGVVSLVAAFPRNQLTPTRRYLAVSAIACALAVLTKIFALAIVPFVGAYILYATWRYPKRWQSIVRYEFLWITIFVLSIFLFWPALWTTAEATITYITGGVSQYSSGTRIGEATSQWWYYLREGFFRLTPPVALLAALALLGSRWSRPSALRRTAYIFLLAGLTYAVILSLRGEKSDRYILFTLLTVDLLAVYGMKILTDWMKKILATSPASVTAGDSPGVGAGQNNNRASFTPGEETSSTPGVFPAHGFAWLKASIVLIPILYLAIDAIRLHPYYHAHYNRLYPIEADHKLGWGEGLEQAAAYIQTNHPGSKVASYYSGVFSRFYQSGDVLGLTGDTNADYLILYRSMFERGPDDPDTDLSQQYIFSDRYTPEHIVYLNGLPYVWIFKNE